MSSVFRATLLSGPYVTFRLGLVSPAPSHSVTLGQGKPWSLHSSGLAIAMYDVTTNLAHDPGYKDVP
jgi:hypothetical protein